MNADDPHHQLRVFVERVVRPIVGEESRKLPMRRELLGHVSAAYDEELARSTVGDPAAIERALARMGDPRELTRELQATIPWASRINAAYDRLIRRRPGVSALRHAGWMTGFALGQWIVVSSAVALLASAWVGPPEGYRGVVGLRLVAFFGVLLAANVFQGSLISGAVWRCLAGEARWRDRLLGAAGRATAGGVLMFIIGIAAWPIVGAPALPWSPVFAGCWAGLSAAFVIGSVVIAELDVRERRGLEEWSTLDPEVA